MTDLDLGTREQRVRRQVAHFGARLKKAPPRHWTRKYYGPGYMVVSESNMAIAGAGSREYESDIEDVERCAFVELPAKLIGKAA